MIELLCEECNKITPHLEKTNDYVCDVCNTCQPRLDSRLIIPITISKDNGIRINLYGDDLDDDGEKL